MQRYRTRGAPFLIHKAPRMPQNSSKKAYLGSPKNAPKKRSVFTEFFHRIFLRIFGVCFSAERTAIATEKRPPKNSARKSITAQSKIQSADVAGLETSQYTHVTSKLCPEKPQISSVRSSAALCLMPLSFWEPHYRTPSKSAFLLQKSLQDTF